MTIEIQNNYNSSTQYNWSGNYDGNNQKIAGDKAESIVKIIYNSNFKNNGINNLSLVKVTVLPGCQQNPVKFKSIPSLFYFFSGNGFLRILDDQNKVLEEYPIKPESSFTIGPNIKHAIVNSSKSNLEGIQINVPAWFKEDEEFEWSLTKFN